MSTSEELLSVPPHLHSRLLDLLNDVLTPYLPEEVRRVIVEHAALGGRKQEDGVVVVVESIEEEKAGEEEFGEKREMQVVAKKEENKEGYIPRQLLVDISRWARTPKATKQLRRVRLDPYDYTLISLCAGTKPFITPAQQRLISNNPNLPNPFLPPHLTAPPATHGPSLGLGQEYRLATKELSAAANVLFSVGGVGGAVWVVGRSSSGLGKEGAALLAITAALITAFAEIWLYVSHTSRAARAVSDGVAARRGEKAEGLGRELGAEAEELERGRRERLEAEEGGAVVVVGEEMAGEEEQGVQQTAREKPMIRLRRRPLPNAAEQ